MMRLAVLVLALAACTYYRTIGDQPDAGPVDAAEDAAGDAAPACANGCSVPNSSTVCVQGRVCQFAMPTVPVTPAEAAVLRVRVYDPIALATNPSATVPLSTSTIDTQGCFTADGIPRPSSGLLAWTVDDADPARDVYQAMAYGAPLQANRNVTDAKAFALGRPIANGWQVDLRAGVWIGQHLDPSGNPVAGVRPTRPGDDPQPGNVFCFRGDRLHLTSEKITDATGLCAIVPDALELHSGVCAAPGCSESWPNATGGTPTGVVTLQTFVGQ